MPCGRPHTSWLRQVESYLKDTGMTGLGVGQTEPVLGRMPPHLT